MTKCLLSLTVAGLVCGSMCLAQTSAPASAPAAKPQMQLKYKFVFTMGGLSGNETALAEKIEIIKRAKKAGYNAVYAQDPRFGNLPMLDEAFASNCRKLRQTCDELGMTLATPSCQMGYSAQLIAIDPNLAEGIPVRNATFVVKDGKLVPADEVKLENGSLAEWKDNTPVGWTVDKPDTVSFRDDKVTLDGHPTLRQEHTSDKGTIRLIQKIKVEPWHYYHISARMKTEDYASKDYRILGYGGDLGVKGITLTWQPPDLKKTQDWTKFDAVFGSMGYEQIYLIVGCYSPKSGKVWIGDVKIEPAGFVNLIRRESLPLTVKSIDGKTTYIEGKDFAKIADPKLGNDPKKGDFGFWHDQPVVTVPAGSGLKEGDKALVSYHFTMTCGKSHQINACYSEPKLYELIEKQLKWIRANVNPDIYMMGHDEIRLAGQDDTCTARKMTCGQLLAENMRKSVAILQRVAPDKKYMVWNDMYDPFHNAKKEGAHYLAKDSFDGSWEGLPTGVIAMNWHNNNADSVKFFDDRSNQQILAGYYDKDPARMAQWLEMAAPYKGVVGVMYTTWLHDYTKLEDWIKVVNDYEAANLKK